MPAGTAGPAPAAGRELLGPGRQQRRDQRPPASEAHLNWSLITLMSRRLTRKGHPDGWKKTGPMRKPGPTTLNQPRTSREMDG
ncbi:hypothetical protein SAVERM_503 [Streptomyces avermitilis MA-4680 = NBRC 14893]|uniref:Uncharacterized protein n=1 Tax=Streptomyces avermitilis (strain ATCC 31267 / DSM 46492 / JCM 5070 / NBRC 14893 / NCIMB 12804 / NRRL 8165 / MA-4680) TaxID=227882 RepID=Q82QK3_STRAW|nr:hypothetical protein SAVERM_503 [Streptomyces avermitilis MA-4680 = NBRC 14893]